jgi:hypothetical protein
MENNIDNEIARLEEKLNQLVLEGAEMNARLIVGTINKIEQLKRMKK